LRRPRFLLRDNLGRLARWLRILGYDAVVMKAIPFSTIISRATKERRIFLSRCAKEMKLPAGVAHQLIRSDNHLKQLRELLPLLVLDESMLFTRCIRCNRLLTTIDPARMQDRIPAYVAQTHKHFTLCRHCGKVYWQGTHYADMKRTLTDIFQTNEETS